MSASTGLPQTFNLDRAILKCFRKLCTFKQKEALGNIGSNKGKKQKVIAVDKDEDDVRSEISRHLEILGTSLGKRLHAKYSDVLSSKLQVEDGYAILELVPDSPNWGQKEKEILLGWMYLEIQPHLGLVKSIKSTFSQVSMRNDQDTLMDKKACPLMYYFLKALHGSEGTLFPSHVYQSFQQLETLAGIPVAITNVEEDGMQFWHNAPVFVEKGQTVETKKKLLERGFLECVPHLHYDPQQLKDIAEKYEGNHTMDPYFFEIPFKMLLG